MTGKLELYHRLPPLLKNIAASARGHHLNSWRYGPETDDLIAEALERQQWHKNDWSAWQDNQLGRILHRAATQVPYYRELWQKRRRSGDRSSWEYLENWRILTKDPLRTNPLQFIAEDVSPGSLYRDQTSGTTGTPVQIFISRKALRRWYALFEARIRIWHGVNRHQNWAILGGQLVIPVSQTHPPYWVSNWAMHQLYLSTHHISPSSVNTYLQALQHFNPSHMIVYPSSAALLAINAEQQGLSALSLQVIFSNAETLLPQQRSILSKVFHCPVVDTYGMGEYAFGAGECSEGNMHAWPETGILEILQPAEDVQLKDKKVAGRMIITSLINPDMPLIRYEIGDLGTSLGYGACACGCSLPLIGPIEGRMNDLVVTPEGRKVFWLNPIFYGLPVREAQIVQTKINQVTIRVLPDMDFREAVRSEIIHRAKQRLGTQMNVEVLLVESIPRTRGGKFKSVVSLEQQDMP